VGGNTEITFTDDLSTISDDTADGEVNIPFGFGAFTSKNHSTKEFTRNPDFWLNDIDFTGNSVSNSRQGRRRAGSLVTKRHIIMAAHFPLHAGDVVWFTDNDNNTISRTILSAMNHPNWVGGPNYDYDLRIALLDEDVPNSISYFEVLPENYEDFMVIDVQRQIPLIIQNRFEEYGVRRGTWRSDLNSVTHVGFRSGSPNYVARNTYAIGLGSGDSGNGIFLLVDGAALLMGCHTGTTFATNISNTIDEINDLIEQVDSDAGVSTGYTLTECDLSGKGFIDFSD